MEEENRASCGGGRAAVESCHSMKRLERSANRGSVGRSPGGLACTAAVQVGPRTKAQVARPDHLESTKINR
jgi:hypothetical protein